MTSACSLGGKCLISSMTLAAVMRTNYLLEHAPTSLNRLGHKYTKYTAFRWNHETFYHVLKSQVDYHLRVRCSTSLLALAPKSVDGGQIVAWADFDYVGAGAFAGDQLVVAEIHLARQLA